MDTSDKRYRRSRRRKLALLVWLALAVVMGSLFWNRGKIYTNASRKLGPEPTTDVQRIPFEVQEPGGMLKYRIRVELQEGLVHIRLVGPNGKILTDASGGRFTLTGPKEDEQCAPGQYLIEIQSERAVGTWRVTIYDKSYSPAMHSSSLVAGKLMALVGVLAVWGWRWRSRAAWRYFLIGGAIWAAGVALKSGWALLLNAPIFKAIGESLSAHAAFMTNVMYIGLLTGVFEIGVTVVAAKAWPRLSLDAGRGVAIGIGAGAAEAIALGMAISLSAVFRPEAAIAGPFSLSLVPVAERLLALLCHASSRAMVLFAAATRRWRWAWGGFILLTGVDTVAGAFLLSKERATLNPWLLELALVPFAIASIIVLVVVVKRWPDRNARPSERQSDDISQP